LYKEADANAISNDNVKPLQMAAFNEHQECHALLINKGAKVNAKEDDGSSPIC
jgi:ankyrin repeat protein